MVTHSQSKVKDLEKERAHPRSPRHLHPFRRPPAFALIGCVSLVASSSLLTSLFLFSSFCLLHTSLRPFLHSRSCIAPSLILSQVISSHTPKPLHHGSQDRSHHEHRELKGPAASRPPCTHSSAPTALRRPRGLTTFPCRVLPLSPWTTQQTGFLGAQILDDLVKAHYKVKATVRNLAKGEALIQKYTAKGASIELVEIKDLIHGDLTKALQGVDAILHVASPYTFNIKE